MNSRRFFAILAVAIVAICAALFVGNLRQRAPDGGNATLLPLLAGQLNTVTGVTIRKGAAQPTVSLRKLGDRWTVMQRADYPADTRKLRKLLQSLASAHVVEEKTADPANYHVLGVDDPATPDTLGTEVAIATPGKTQVLIVGKASAGGNFVRLSGEARSLLVAPGISPDGEPRDWIDARLLDIKAAEVRQFEVKPASGPPVRLQSAAFGALAGLTAEDVVLAGDIDFKSAAVAAITLADGAVISLKGAVAGDKRWLTLASSMDAALTEKARGRAYQVGASRYDAIFKP
jgi:hypothetical protein